MTETTADFKWVSHEDGYKPSLIEGRIASVAIFITAATAACVGLVQYFNTGWWALSYLVWAYLISALVAQTWFGIALIGAARNLQYFTGKTYRPWLFGLIYIGPFVIILAYAMFLASRSSLPPALVKAVYDYSFYPFMGAAFTAWFVAPFFVHRIHRDSVRLTDESWSGKSIGSVGIFYFLMYCATFLVPAHAPKWNLDPAVLSIGFTVLADLMLQRIVHDIIIAQELAAKKLGVGVLDIEPLRNRKPFSSKLAKVVLRITGIVVVILIVWVNLSDLYRIFSRW